MTKLLELDSVLMRFGGVTALEDVNFYVDEGEIFGLIGPNGAGKTTVFNVVTGVYRPTAGVVRFDGQELRKQRRSDITKLGIARTFQNIRLFPVMTALENVMVAADTHNPSSVGGAIVRVGRFSSSERAS
jgi:branched-chain amino acid transport system ATP-binding protein